MRLTTPCFGIQAVILALSSVVSGLAQTPAPQKPITLDEAIHLAEANEPMFAAAIAESRVTALQSKDAKAALLPSVIFHNQYLYTESNHVKSSSGTVAASQSLPVFIANNTVHEYVSQGVVNEIIGLAPVAAVHLADATAARDRAELEISRRGLVSTVVQLYYGVRAGNQKLAVAQRALDEANRFVDITEKRESGSEAAHSDVLKDRDVLSSR